ncbi:NUDIX hydrolase [Roseomonas sp. E05]|uniref:NUDIX hydrolase n=1 Tax=Roseomonas sp. E05 TaxID=3046310 RepID=UPI0024B9C6CD|nr:NUDIX hydrolase [Roseomonas sp. E05]MDJ0389126.1 NUDIX hydrolase [Roseomonas sp. E05]
MPDKPLRSGGQQFAALPVAEIEGEVRVLLVTSRETRRWVLPKGWAEEGLTPAELAAKEAFEEAGALGRVATQAIGSYRYSKRLKTGQELCCEVGVFPLHVERLLREWPEAHQRERRWFSPVQAAEQVQEEDLAALLRCLPELPPGT